VSVQATAKHAGLVRHGLQAALLHRSHANEHAELERECLSVDTL